MASSNVSFGISTKLLTRYFPAFTKFVLFTCVSPLAPKL
jgi:hypothetical protein